MSTTMTLSEIPFTPIQTDDDAALLRRYACGREQAAFNRLVDRHGPMVLGVCQRLLGEGAEADQAFQDAFLALARRAQALHVPVSGLGPWLYETARRSALKISSRRARVAAREVTLASISEPVVEEEHPNEVLPVLDESLATLPRREREVLVQCYLQGRTHAEIAQAMGIAPGTISYLVNRGLDLLRQAMTQRGVTASSAALGVLAAPTGLHGATLLCPSLPTPLATVTTGKALAVTASTSFVGWLVATCALVLGAGVIGGVLTLRHPAPQKVIAQAPILATQSATQATLSIADQQWQTAIWRHYTDAYPVEVTKDLWERAGVRCDLPRSLFFHGKMSLPSAGATVGHIVSELQRQTGITCERIAVPRDFLVIACTIPMPDEELERIHTWSESKVFAERRAAAMRIRWATDPRVLRDLPKFLGLVEFPSPELPIYSQGWAAFEAWKPFLDRLDAETRVLFSANQARKKAMIPLGGPDLPDEYLVIFDQAKILRILNDKYLRFSPTEDGIPQEFHQHNGAKIPKGKKQTFSKRLNKPYDAKRHTLLDLWARTTDSKCAEELRAWRKSEECTERLPSDPLLTEWYRTEIVRRSTNPDIEPLFQILTNLPPDEGLRETLLQLNLVKSISDTKDSTPEPFRQYLQNRLFVDHLTHPDTQTRIFDEIAKRRSDPLLAKSIVIVPLLSGFDGLTPERLKILQSIFTDPKKQSEEFRRLVRYQDGRTYPWSLKSYEGFPVRWPDGGGRRKGLLEEDGKATVWNKGEYWDRNHGIRANQMNPLEDIFSIQSESTDCRDILHLDIDEAHFVHILKNGNLQEQAAVLMELVPKNQSNICLQGIQNRLSTKIVTAAKECLLKNSPPCHDHLLIRLALILAAGGDPDIQKTLQTPRLQENVMQDFQKGFLVLTTTEDPSLLPELKTMYHGGRFGWDSEKKCFGPNPDGNEGIRNFATWWISQTAQPAYSQFLVDAAREEPVKWLKPLMNDRASGKTTRWGKLQTPKSDPKPSVPEDKKPPKSQGADDF